MQLFIGQRSKRFVALLAATLAAAALAAPSAGASAGGTVGEHSLGWIDCNYYGQTITIHTPRLFAVNARYGGYNDFQHVDWTPHVYYWNGSSWQYVGAGERQASYTYGLPGSDSSSAYTGNESETFEFNVHGRFIVMLQARWFDYPAAYGSDATARSVTGWIWSEVGRCDI